MSKLKKYYYSITTGLVHSQGKNNYFVSDKDAWNKISKEMDAIYKTGGGVLGVLVKHGVDIKNIHESCDIWKKYHTDLHTGCCDVAVGYIAYDWDGVPWNNPTKCRLCGCDITSKRFRDYLHCKYCQPVINSLCAWRDHKDRVKSKITIKLLEHIKTLDVDAWKNIDFLVRDGTIELEEGDSI